jgi:hypothetical protein
MALPLVVAGIAARAVAGRVTKAVAKKSTQKTVKKIIQKSKTNQVAKNSVKVKPMQIKLILQMQKLTYQKCKIEKNKSGDLAKGQARLEEKRNQISNQFFGKDKPIKINSSIKSKKAVKKPSTKKK